MSHSPNTPSSLSRSLHSQNTELCYNPCQCDPTANCHSVLCVCVFFRGKGPLKNTSDVISAAKKIAEAGSRMDKLGRTIADQVSDRHVENVDGRMIIPFQLAQCTKK